VRTLPETSYFIKPFLLQAISKMRLMPHGGVATRLKILKYYLYAAPFRLLAPLPKT
jgi:hypothetical protein